jgi:hypothetical protein
MDFATLASMTISAIVPFLIKGGEEIAQGIGKDLWALIKNPFQTEKDKSLIKQLEEKPDDQKLQGKVEIKLSELLEAYHDVAQQISSILPKAQEESKKLSLLIKNSKNVVAFNKIVTNGDFRVGDNK